MRETNTNKPTEIEKLANQRGLGSLALPINGIEMAFLDATGDTKKIWNKDSPEEVEDAKRSFDYFTKEKRYLAFKVQDNGDKGEQVREFNAAYGKMIFVPPMKGG